MSLSALEREVGELIIEALNLEETTVDDIDPEAPLFGDGLGLDSIDALEMALAISRRYGFQLKADDSRNADIFATLRNLSAHVEANRADA